MATKPFLKTFMTKQNLILLVLIICSMGVFAAAIDPIPEEGGLSGRVNVGAGWLRVKSNMFSGTTFGDLSSNRIDSLLDEPDSETNINPVLGGELRYTFADTRTQVFLGSSLIDRLRFDLSTAAGVRKQWDETGIFEGAVLFSSIPTEVWEDPYITGQKREETDRSSTGGRFSWSRIYNSNFHATYSYRDIEIDDEFSGVWLGLPTATQDLLNREGDHHQAELLYTHQLAENQWIGPAIKYDHYGLDGDAMSNDMVSLMLSHTFATEKWRLVSNLLYGYADYDERNPIYQKTQDAHRYGISATLLFPNFFKVENLTGIFGVAYLAENANIDFYDTEIITVSASTMYTF
ncbi:MAG: DUF2860 family protein [Planctomycetota bacterium]|jgi:hypothetical protein